METRVEVLRACANDTFKSYYVVWKPHGKTRYSQRYQRLNRTM